MSELEPVKYEDYEVGQSASFTKIITEEDVMKFAEVTGDFNPIHVNPDFAKTQMFGKQVAHGALSYLDRVYCTEVKRLSLLNQCFLVIRALLLPP